jgi:hypothetical protein
MQLILHNNVKRYDALNQFKKNWSDHVKTNCYEELLHPFSIRGIIYKLLF